MLWLVQKHLAGKWFSTVGREVRVTGVWQPIPPHPPPPSRTIAAESSMGMLILRKRMNAGGRAHEEPCGPHYSVSWEPERVTGGLDHAELQGLARAPRGPP